MLQGRTESPCRRRERWHYWALPSGCCFRFHSPPLTDPLLVAVGDSNGVWGTLTLYPVANQLERMKE